MNASILAIQIDSLSGILKSFAYSLTKDVNDSEDLLQDTVLRALTNYTKFEKGTNLKAWLMTIMRNIFINNYRKKKRRATFFDSSETNYFIDKGGNIVTNGGEDALLRQEISAAMDAISKDHSVPFLMYFEGYKYEEISEILNLPLGTVKSRIFLARKDLKSRLKNSRK